eukprot:15543889-Heterocapsa_arctica.AAC.1
MKGLAGPPIPMPQCSALGAVSFPPMDARTPLLTTSARSDLLAEAGKAHAFMTCEIQAWATLSNALLWSLSTTALSLSLGSREGFGRAGCLPLGPLRRSCPLPDH